MTEEMSGLGTVRQSSCSLTLAIAQWQQSPALEALNWRGFESCRAQPSIFVAHQEILRFAQVAPATRGVEMTLYCEGK